MLAINPVFYMSASNLSLFRQFSLFLILFTAVLADAAEAYRIVDLGVLSGCADGSYATAINDAGTVVGQSGNPDDPKGPCGAFVWDAANGLSDIGRVDGFAPLLYAINGQGVAVGYLRDYFRQCPIRWDRTNGIENISYHGAFSLDQTALAINDAGTIALADWLIGSPQPKPFAGGAHAYLDVGGNVTWIGDLYGSANPFAHIYTTPYGINNSNEVAGISGPRAFCWSPKKGMTNLGILDGFDVSQAQCINDTEQIAGFCHTYTYGFYKTTAFAWSPDKGMTELTCNGIGGSNSVAVAINSVGVSVGNCQVGATNRAVVWPPGKDAIDLSCAITNMSGWTVIQKATGINSSGMIAGAGLRADGITHACVLYPVTIPTIDIGLFAGIIISNAVNGSKYAIQASSDPNSTAWDTVTNVVISSEQYIYVDYGSYANARRFYRAVRQ